MTHTQLTDTTGAMVPLGTMVRPIEGGRAWRAESIVEHRGEHRVRCSQSHPRMGRVQRTFHPSAFGLVITVSVEFYRDRAWFMRQIHECALQAVLLTVGGVIAWIIAEYGQHHGQWILELFGA